MNLELVFLSVKDLNTGHHCRLTSLNVVNILLEPKNICKGLYKRDHDESNALNTLYY